MIYAHITANLHQSRTLATLRDTLLPKLLSGELSVSAMETSFSDSRASAFQPNFSASLAS